MLAEWVAVEEGTNSSDNDDNENEDEGCGGMSEREDVHRLYSLQHHHTTNLIYGMS